MGVFRTFDRVKKWLDFRIHTRRQPTKVNIQPIYKLRFAMVAKIYNQEKPRIFPLISPTPHSPPERPLELETSWQV